MNYFQGTIVHTKTSISVVIKSMMISLTWPYVSILRPWFIWRSELVDGVINMLRAEEYPRPYFNQMKETTVRRLAENDIIFANRCRIFVGAANPLFIRALKERLDEDTNYEPSIAYLRRQYPAIYDLQHLQEPTFVIPINFNKEHKIMLAQCKEMLEYQQGIWLLIQTNHCIAYSGKERGWYIRQGSN